VTEYHRLGSADFSALASGLGGAAAVRELGASQLSRHLLLLKFVSEQWPADRRELDAAVSTLAQAQQRNAEVFTELLGDPLVGAWLARTARRLRHPEQGAFPLRADLLHLGGLAASAAIQLGLDCQLTGYARHGLLTIPGLGEAVLPGGTDGPLSISVANGRGTLRGSFGEMTVPTTGHSWRELRTLTARLGHLGCRVAVQDGNPYRDGYHAPPTGRLTAEEVGRWQEHFTGAWDLICRCLPQRASELAVGLRAVVPLMDDGAGGARSGTVRDSVGALGLTRPRSAHDFAITIVHEFQHSKLSALLDLLPMYVAGGTERHFAPWRVDARPIAGLIQGVYAFLGVADAWHGLRAVAELEETATGQLAMVREQVRVGLDALEASAELTADGRQLAAGMRVALERLLAEPLPAAVVDQAQASLRTRRSAWLLRHPDLNQTHRRPPP
jgi:HEXXH motif-containing protein